MREYDTCAHALPNLPPLRVEDGQKLYRVTKFCCKSGTCEGITILRNSKTHCQECPKYTDRSKYIRIQNGDFRAEIFLDRLTDFSTPNLRKLFKLMLSADWENEAAIMDTSAYLDAAVLDGKKEWEDASAVYRSCYRDAKNAWGLILSAKQRRDINRENARLTKMVKQAKSQYEHWVKIQALWDDTKHQMNIK